MRARLRHFLAAATLTLAFGSAARAEPLAYAAGYDELFRIDLANGRATRIGAFGTIGATAIVDVEGLAFAPDGTLYGVTDGLKLLLRIDTGTGRATAVGVLRESGQAFAVNQALDVGLAFTCDGRLWMSSDASGRLWELNPATGEARSVGNTIAKLSGLAGYGSRLVGLGVSGDEGIWNVDRTTGAATLATRLTPATTFDDAGLDFDSSGQLWGTRHFFPPLLRSDLFRIDAVTGVTTPLFQIEFGPGIADKTIDTIAIAPPGGCNTSEPIGPPGGLQPQARAVPVDAPFALALLGALVALVAAWRLRRPAH